MHHHEIEEQLCFFIALAPDRKKTEDTKKHDQIRFELKCFWKKHHLKYFQKIFIHLSKKLSTEIP